MRPPRWMEITEEKVSADGRSLDITIHLKWWRWLDPTFWWAVIRGPG